MDAQVNAPVCLNIEKSTGILNSSAGPYPKSFAIPGEPLPFSHSHSFLFIARLRGIGLRQRGFFIQEKRDVHMGGVPLPVEHISK